MDLRTPAFTALLDRLHVEWSPDDGPTDLFNFKDESARYQAVTNLGGEPSAARTALVDLSSRDTLVIRGSDTIPWLQGLVTNDLFHLAREGAGQRSTSVNGKGRLLADLRLLHMPELLLADLEFGRLDSGYLSHLRRHIITEDVQLLDRSAATAKFGVFGPHAGAALDEIAHLQSSAADLAPYHGTWGTLADVDVVVQRCDWTGAPGLLICFPRLAQATIWETLMNVALPVGQSTFETLRIEAGVVRFGAELTEKIIPLEAGLDDTVAYDKGCYLGQEIIARLDTLGTPARLLRTLVFEGGAAPSQGATLLSEGRKAGFIASSTWSPRLNAPIALAYVKRKYNAIGHTVQVEGRACTVQALGFPTAS